MNAADSQALRQQYAARWLELKHTLTAKYFSDKDLAGARARPCRPPVAPLNAGFRGPPAT
jgi:hypothetical protein